jgi:signal peptidase II
LARAEARLSWLTPGRMAFFTVAVIVFVVDRVTKTIVGATIPYGGEVQVLGGLVSITNIRNSGAAFGFAPAGASFFLIAAIVVAVALVIYVARQPTDLATDAILGLVLGGTVGNGFDRVMAGSVTDFVNVHFWPVFNVADASISTGVALLVAGYFLRR